MTSAKNDFFAIANFKHFVHAPQAMDTASFPAAAATSTKHDADGMKTAAHPNVIQAYKCIVKTMIGLMLRLSTEGPSQPVVQGLEAAASSLVRHASIVIMCTAFMPALSLS